MNEGQCGNQINIIYINRKKKTKEGSENLRELTVREKGEGRKKKKKKRKEGNQKGNRKELEKISKKVRLCINIC